MDFISNAVEVYFRDNKGGIARGPSRMPNSMRWTSSAGISSGVREERQPLVTGEDGLRALRVAHAIRKKSMSGARSWLLGSLSPFSQRKHLA